MYLRDSNDALCFPTETENHLCMSYLTAFAKHIYERHISSVSATFWAQAEAAFSDSG